MSNNNEETTGTATGSLDANQPTNNVPETVISTGGRELESTTAFTSDAEIKVAIPNNPSWFKKLFSKSNDTYVQDIKTFLAKPIQIAGGTFGVGDTVSTYPSQALPNTIINSYPIWANKLKGFLGLRCDLVIRLQVNANQFQQGRYMLCWVPAGGSQYASARWAQHYSMHTSTLVQRTQLHHVEIDVNLQTEVILKIPYNSIFNYLEIDSMINNPTNCGTLGLLQIFPYSNLVAPSGSTTCTYSLWASLENVELIGATIPQMGTEQEQKQAGVGPLESSLVKISNASNIWADVPLVGAYATTLGWVSDMLAGTAHIFGWSKPANLAHADYFQRQGLHQFCNYETVDNSQVVAYTSRNQVEVAPGFAGTTTDELDFSHFASIPAYQYQFAWTTAQAGATTLFSTLCSPNTSFQTTNGSGTNLVNNYPPCGFLAQYFNLWRGTMVYKLKFVKTGFHSGRIAVSFWPSSQTIVQNPANYTLANTNYLHREIIDIRSANEFIFRIPFVSSTPYKYSNATFFGSTTGTDSGNSTSGILAIHVLDALIAPSSVSSTVTILVECAGGPDLEFAQPRNISMAPLGNTVPQMNTGENPELLYEGHIGASGFQEDRVANAVVCIGERLRSFRAMLRIPYILNTTGGVAWAGAKFFTILPFAIPMYTAGAVSDNLPNNNPDLYATLACIYLYSRGGIRTKLQSSATPTATFWNASLVPIRSPITQNIMISTGSAPLSGADTYLQRNYVPHAFSQASQNCSAEFTIPQYNPTHSRVNFDYITDGTTQYYPSGSNSMKNTNALNINMGNATDSIKVQIYRSGADDCNFGCFISVPPMTLLQSPGLVV